MEAFAFSWTAVAMHDLCIEASFALLIVHNLCGVHVFKARNKVLATQSITFTMHDLHASGTCPAALVACNKMRIT